MWIPELTNGAALTLYLNAHTARTFGYRIKPVTSVGRIPVDIKIFPERDGKIKVLVKLKE